MYERRERYLRERAERNRRRRGQYEQNSMDYRSGDSEYRDRYDSRDSHNRYEYEKANLGNEQFRKSPRIYGNDMRRDYRRYYSDYDYDSRGDSRDNRDYARGDNRDSDYRDYRDYDYRDSSYDKEYEEDLKKWIEKLKGQDRFSLGKEQAIQRAKTMGVNFKEYSEEEFYAIYLMHVSDYPTIANEPHTYLAMAKAWLEDKDLKIEPSEKVCKYLYEIVMAEE